MTALGSADDSRQRDVLVLVSADCPGCAESRRVVAEVLRMRPQTSIEVLDVASGQVPVGVPFVGTPSYVMDGRVISYGNPRPADLLAVIEGARR